MTLPVDALALPLQSWLRLQRDAVPLAQRAEALRHTVLACGPVRQAWYLCWQASSCTYAQEGGGLPLPPGQGDPLEASDLRLFERLQQHPQLSLEALRQLPCWLAGRLRRAALSHGQALALELLPGQPGLLLLEVNEDASLDWLPGLHSMLGQFIQLASGMARSAPLLAADPQPTVLLDAQAQLLDSNLAVQRLLGERPLSTLAQLLPVNYVPLVRACLSQGRAIEAVEAEDGARILVWSFIPDPVAQRVLARCRDASVEVHEAREATQARRLYRLITENTTDLISRHTPDGCFLDASPASWTLLGYWPEQLRGVRVQSLFHPQDQAVLVQRTAEALEQAGYHTMTYRIRHQAGHYLWFETASRAIRETYTGAVVEVVSVSRDITARVQAEENKRRLADVVEANPDPVLFIDPAGGVSYLNPAGRRILGLTPTAPMPCLEAFLSPKDLERLKSLGWRSAELNGLWSTETRLLPLNAQPSVPVQLLLLAHRSSSGERFFSLVARDMRERELREAQQRHHQDEMAHTARLITLGELASGIAHEINQPLAAVVNYANASQRYLQTLGDNPQARERVAQGLERINLHANHASEVIKRLRGFLRKGRRTLQALDVREIAAQAVSLCAWEAREQQVTIEQDVPDILPLVFADRVLLEQVLLNLLRNAIDANREQHLQQPSSITLRVQSHDAHWLHISVQDQGPGVSAEQFEQLFTPFYTSKPDGLGLGLSMSRSIIEGFAGELDACRQAEGLLLTCRLPMMGSLTQQQKQGA